MKTTTTLREIPLPATIRSRTVDNINGLSMHVLEAGFETRGRPCVLLLHGFPELAFSWRKVMPALSEAGYHVIAPDQRGYGRTTGWQADYDGNLAPFRLFNLVRDALGLVSAFGYRHVNVVGHDFGSPVASWCALMRPDVFRAVTLMSAPFGGAPRLGTSPPLDVPSALAGLDPPRQHYQWYYSTRQANLDMHHPREGLHSFLRAYYHVKSADWPGNEPRPLAGWRAAELARLPHYYVMPAGLGMPAAVAPYAPAADDPAPQRWLPDVELAVYTSEFARTGFQGALNWYRCITDSAQLVELTLFDGRRIDAPAFYIAGAADWGIFQSPGAFERMQTEACARWLGAHLVPGAGHWVQQEQPAQVESLLLEFLLRARDGP